MSLIKLHIHSYYDEGFSKEKKDKFFEAQLNPTSLKITKNITYSEEGIGGVAKDDTIFKSLSGDDLSFDLTLDNTGIIPYKLLNDSIIKSINLLEQCVFNINNDTHQPSFVKIIWGNLVYKGKCKSFSYDYTLFDANGNPIRAKISLSFTTHKKYKDQVLNSPDVTRVVEWKSHYDLTEFCQDIYNDPSYIYDVAAYNDLTSLRNTPTGLKITFPSISNYE